MSAIVVLILRILMALALYGFLGWAFFTLWRDLKQQSDALTAQRLPEISLAFKDSLPQAVKLFRQPEVTIGRDPTCDFPLSDETVSARHASLKYHHHQWWVEDHTSTNGTYLNKELLVTATVIVSGDELRCGSKIMEIKIHNPSSGE